MGLFAELHRKICPPSTNKIKILVGFRFPGHLRAPKKAFNKNSLFWADIIDAQSFSNSFEGVHGVVKKSGRGSSMFVFYCIFMLQFFKLF
jgi:hypothetical protein